MAILLKGEYMRFLKLADITAYRKSFDLSNTAWKIIIKWDYFAKDTVGKQFCRAINSIITLGDQFMNRWIGYKNPKSEILLQKLNTNRCFKFFLNFPKTSTL